MEFLSTSDDKFDFYRRFADAQDQKKFTDVKFSCRSRENGSQVLIEAHQVVLMLASSAFTELFELYDHWYGSNFRCQIKKEVIEIDDLHADAFQALIDVIYKKPITIKSFEMAVELQRGGIKYRIEKARDYSTAYFVNNLNANTVVKFYELSCAYGFQTWKNICITRFKFMTDAILTSQSFISCTPDTLKLIFSLDSLHISSELELINAYVKYIEANERFKVQAKEALKQIRVLTIPANDIVRIKFLTTDEMVRIIRVINGDEAENSMPPGFSRNRVNRCTKRPNFSVQGRAIVLLNNKGGCKVVRI